MTTFLECFHLLVDVAVCGVCGLSLYQWRWWMLRAAKAEQAAADAWNVARHFHERVQKEHAEAKWRGEAS